MRQLVFVVLAAYAVVGLSSAAGRSRVKGLRFPSNAVSQYFLNVLSGYFPNEQRPTSHLVEVGNTFQLLFSGPPAAPVEVIVPITLQTNAGLRTTCLAIVHLGNAVTGNLNTLYFGEEADLRDPLNLNAPCP